MLEMNFYIVEDVDLANRIFQTSEEGYSLLVAGNKIVSNPAGDVIYGKILICMDADLHVYYLALKGDKILQLPEYTPEKIQKIVNFYDATKNLESLALIESLIAL